MAHPLKELRRGDVIAIFATVTDRKVGDSIVVKSASQNDIIIHYDADIEKVVKFEIQKGDRVRWHDGTEKFGVVLAISSDENQTYVWVREEGKWPRLTLNIKDLKRI